MPARFLIGIDLGTTNSAVAYVDTAAADPRVRVFEVPQLVAPGEVAPRRQLPSFVYLAGDIDLAAHELALPWRADGKEVVGELARAQGARMASRMIASAKSWLCHPGVDRNAAILPWGAGDGSKRSPVAAQALVLRHIRDAWDFAMKVPFADQEVLVTVPASFDEAARELTLQAAVMAAYPPVVLLEEPQAAFYAWIDNARGARGGVNPAASPPERGREGPRSIDNARGAARGGVNPAASPPERGREGPRSIDNARGAARGGVNPAASPPERGREGPRSIDNARGAARGGVNPAASPPERGREGPRSIDNARGAARGGVNPAASPPERGREGPRSIERGREGPRSIDNARGGGGRASKLSAGERVLVFDVGGGTTDFTLIDVDAGGDAFTRTAVGDHLLLGGDNLDLTLAKLVEQRVAARTGKQLDALQWHGLVHACRLAKEALLGGDAPAAPIVVHGRGAKLIGGTLRDEISRGELDRVLLDGFFPVVARDAPLSRARGGLQEFGLPYAADPAITKHLAQFLSRHGADRIDAVLFNGGAMTPRSLRDRVLDQIAQWQPARPRELPAAMPELAVAQGAAYYGLVRRGLATRIKGGTARAFYIGVESAAAERLAVCLAPSGLDDGARVQLARDFRLVTNRPVSFRLYSSSTRDDQPGAVVPIGDGRADTLDDGSDLLELPPIVTVLRARGRGEVTVRLEVHITALGALEVFCVDTQPQPAETWKLAFDMRAGGGADTAPADDAPPHPRLEDARAMVAAAFRTGTGLQTLMRDLEALLDARRDEWTTHTSRALFDVLVDVAAERKRSADHEQRWLNLAGFLLRPGTGAPLDAWRARVMWGVFNENLAFAKPEANRLAWWICWRRIAGGLATGQQDQLWDRLGQLLVPSAKQARKLADAKPSKQELAEMWRTIASLERLAVASKLRLGDELARKLADPKARDDGLAIWALARIGARVPLYGPANLVVPPGKVVDWLAAMLTWPAADLDRAAFALAQLGRRTGDRVRDLDDATRGQLAAALRGVPSGERAVVLVEQVVELEAREERVVFGDTLPAGLRLAPDSED